MHGGIDISDNENQKAMVEELKVEWKRLWLERMDDKVRAEGIAIKDYSKLFIDKGLIIHATRDFKPLSFKEILDQHKILNSERYIPPSPEVGGWKKFVKSNITSQTLRKEPEKIMFESKKKKVQAKKSGRGWLHNNI
jgi:hypothetical protein